MGHSHGTEDLLTGIRPPHCSTNHRGSGYYNHIIYFILCYPIVMVTTHSTVTYFLYLAMNLSGKILVSVATINIGLALHWNYYTHGLPLKLELRHDGHLCCECELMIHTDIYIGCITEDGDSLVDSRSDF